MSTRNRAPYLGVVRTREIPRPGVRILPRAGLIVIVVAWLATGFHARDAHAQAVVPPAATYIGPASGPAATAAATWRLAADANPVLRVRFDPPPGNGAAFWLPVRRALDTWSDLPETPFEFVYVPETEPAEIEFRWIDRFTSFQAGTTHRRLDADGHIERVTVVLAREHSNAVPMSEEFLHLVALHEIGHALGLPHSENPGDVMHPGNRNLRISSRDRHSLATLYGTKE